MIRSGRNSRLSSILQGQLPPTHTPTFDIFSKLIFPHSSLWVLLCLSDDKHNTTIVPDWLCHPCSVSLKPPYVNCFSKSCLLLISNVMKYMSGKRRSYFSIYLQKISWPKKYKEKQKVEHQKGKTMHLLKHWCIVWKNWNDDSQEFLQVFLEPFDIVLCHAICNQEVGWPQGEHQRSMKSCVIVFMCHLDTSSTEPCDIHDPIISKNIILTCQNVGLGQRV